MTQRQEAGPSRAPQRRRRPRADLPRRVAFDALRAVDERDAYANLVLPQALRDNGLEGRDAAFATELVYGTLRMRGLYDAVIAESSTRPNAEIDAPVLDVLRLGVHQLLGMRVPSHAAVSATVELARAVTGEGRAKFVNAVLRKADRRDQAGWIADLATAEDPVARLALAYSHPSWIVSAFRDALGSDEELEELLRADNEAPAVTLVARPGRANPAELPASPARWSPYAAILESGDPGDVPAVREGRAGVQDEGSQLMALALAAAPLDGPDRRWLDLCAGPGGKAALLGAIARQRGAAVLAAELQSHRAKLVARAAGGTAGVVVADGMVPPWVPGFFDRVLVDVPCTGLGALRRRPEARWRRTVEDVARLAPLQRGLLGSALDAVRPGGLVAYVTCSPHIAETRVVVADVLRSRDDVTRVDARSALPAMPGLGPGPDVQLWPHRHGTDAMYLSLLTRTST